jgi:hypothetical protein
MITVEKLKPLDIIFTYYVQTPLDELIAQCGLNYGEKLINHVGLYIGNNQVIEASREGVVITQLQAFIKGQVYIKRPNLNLNAQEIQNIITKAKLYLNKNYNHSFKDDEENIYCSELIIRAFEAIGNKNPFQRHSITFNNHKTNKLDPRWLEYYKNEDDIPEGQLGSHPNKLYSLLS